MLLSLSNVPLTLPGETKVNTTSPAVTAPFSYAEPPKLIKIKISEPADHKRFFLACIGVAPVATE
jgi:hypothetical protein